VWDEDEYFELAQRQYMERVRGDGEVPSAEQFAALQQVAGVIHTAQRTGVLSSTWNAPAEAAGLAEALMYLRVGAPGPLLANQVEALAETVLKVRRATSGWNPPGYANSDDDELYDEQAAKRWHDTWGSRSLWCGCWGRLGRRRAWSGGQVDRSERRRTLVVGPLVVPLQPGAAGCLAGSVVVCSPWMCRTPLYRYSGWQPG
jgi:hypothetical protein